MWPLVGIPQAIVQGMAAYGSVFCREAGFEHVSRDVSGLLLRANKTWQGIYSQWVFPPGAAVSRRAMHEAVADEPLSDGDDLGGGPSTMGGWAGRGGSVSQLCRPIEGVLGDDGPRELQGDGPGAAAISGVAALLEKPLGLPQANGGGGGVGAADRGFPTLPMRFTMGCCAALWPGPLSRPSSTDGIF